MYFSTETTNQLEERCLTLFEKDTGVKGEVKKFKTKSRMADWNEAEMTSIQQRTYDFEVVPKTSTGVGSHHYIFIYKNGKWILKSKLH